MAFSSPTPRPATTDAGHPADADEPGILTGLKVYSFQKNLELLLCILAIMLLVTLALTHFDGARRKAQVIQAVADHGPATRTAIHYYHALHGSWPDRETTLELICQQQPSACQPESGTGRPPLTDAIRSVQDGAITIATPAVHDGQTLQLTLHPAVPSGDPLGPVIWLAGPVERPGWVAMGQDHSDTAALPFIPRELL